VRDRIPELISRDGKVAITQTLSGASMIGALREKLKEECDEVNSAVEAADLAKELSDVLEVVYALADLHGLTREHLEEIREQRALERGAFRQRVWLEETYPLRSNDT
jgi:predicted house-cleaning noncanonical NTP pyrophosphatase (MazG superfamily)